MLSLSEKSTPCENQITQQYSLSQMAPDAFRQDSSTESCTDDQIVRHDLHVHLI